MSGDSRTRRASTTVIDGVPEGDRSDESDRRRELQRAAAVDEIEVTGRVRDGVKGGDHQHVAIRVGVVVEHRQYRRAPGTDAEVVVDRSRRVIHRGALGERIFEGLRGRLLVTGLLALLLSWRGYVTPIVNETHVLVYQPNVAVAQVVESDDRAVHSKLEFAASGRLLDIVANRFLAVTGE